MSAPTDRSRIAVLIACFNRRELTLRALRAIAGGGPFDLSVVVFDDGSTDDTAQAVRAEFPSAIILKGDGTAYWNGGMHRAWTHALQLEVDGYLWLNDDVVLDADALTRLATQWHAQGGREAPFILVGATRGPDGALTYGGMNREHSPFALRFVRQPEADALRAVDTFNGNIVLISRPTVERIGINEPRFFHALGDIDYGLRASAAGIPVLLMPGTLGVCAANTAVGLRHRSWRERWRRVNTHRGLPFASWWLMTRRYSGIWAIPHFLLAYRRLVLPASRRSA